MRKNFCLQSHIVWLGKQPHIKRKNSDRDRWGNGEQKNDYLAWEPYAQPHIYFRSYYLRGALH